MCLVDRKKSSELELSDWTKLDEQINIGPETL
jgi:hypothetical protein